MIYADRDSRKLVDVYMCKVGESILEEVFFFIQQ